MDQNNSCNYFKRYEKNKCFQIRLISKILLTVVASGEGNRAMGDQREREITFHFYEKVLLHILNFIIMFCLFQIINA